MFLIYFYPQELSFFSFKVHFYPTGACDEDVDPHKSCILIDLWIFCHFIHKNSLKGGKIQNLMHFKFYLDQHISDTFSVLKFVVACSSRKCL